MSYSDFQNIPSSSKNVLTTIDGSSRLMGWNVHSGNVYKLENFNHNLIIDIQEHGISLNVVGSIGAVVAGSYYFDFNTRTIYLQTIGSVNPNTTFQAVTVRFFFANEPLTLPYDLDTGFDVYWEPLVKSTSDFTNNIDTINQVGESIDGQGTINLINDNTLWNVIFDLWTFDNKPCSIYSWSRGLPLSEIQILFKGFITDKKYSSTSIQFQLKDQFKEIRQVITLANIGDLGGKVSEDQLVYKQRMIFGRVFGHIATNIDQIVDGYPLTGLVRAIYDNLTGIVSLSFVGTQFLTELSPQDSLVINGIELEVATVIDNTTVTFADELPYFQPFWDTPLYVKPDNPKTFMNRIYSVAGHALREPITACKDNCTIATLYVDSNKDIYADDYIYVGVLGSGELVRVKSVSGTTLIFLATSLSVAPTVSTIVTRPAIQNVRINKLFLTYYRDYTFNAASGILTLRNVAERNVAPVNSLGFDATFTLGSKNVTGTGFSQLQSGWYIGAFGEAEYYEIHSITDDTNLVLTEVSGYSHTGLGRYKNVIIDEDSIINCDILGMTEDGTTNGVLLKTGPQICKKLLQLSTIDNSFINFPSFDYANAIVYQELGMVIPQSFSNSDTPTYTDIINEINKSIFGALVIKHIGLNTGLYYHVLHAKKDIVTTKRFNQYDLLSFNFDSTSKYTIRNINMEYSPKEYNWTIEAESISTYVKVSDDSQYVVKTEKEKTITTRLATLDDAKIMAARWSFILSNSMGMFEFKTKLQGASLNVGDIIEIEHPKMFNRIGGDKRRIFLIESISKNGYGVSIQAVDFSNTFNRVACINEFTNDFFTATDDELLYGGYITDEYGMQDNLPETFGINLIW